MRIERHSFPRNLFYAYGKALVVKEECLRFIQMGMHVKTGGKPTGKQETLSVEAGENICSFRKVQTILLIAH